MKRFFAITAAGALALSAGCSTVMPTQQSGFLSNYTGLSHSEDTGSNSMRAAEKLDPARIVISNVEWRVPASDGVSAKEQAKLMNELRSALQAEVGQMPADPNGHAAVLRAAITGVQPVSPALNVLSAALVLLPLDRGGASVELEAVDADSQKQIAALSMGYFAPMSDVSARFSRLAPAKIAEQKAAKDFVALLQP